MKAGLNGSISSQSKEDLSGWKCRGPGRQMVSLIGGAHNCDSGSALNEGLSRSATGEQANAYATDRGRGYNTLVKLLAFLTSVKDSKK